MKKIYTLTALLSILFVNNAIAQNDAAAQKTIDAVNAKIKSLKGFTASYTSVTIDKNKKALGTLKGTVTLKGKKFYATMGKAEIISDGTKLWNYDGDKEVTVGKAEDAAADWLSPQVFIDGIDTKDFSYTLISTTGSIQQVQLLPVDKRKNITQVILFIDKTKSLITKINLTDKSGSTTIISFSNLNTNAVIPDTKFVFDAAKHPGVEVVEQ